MEITVRPAVEADLPALLVLLYDEFYPGEEALPREPATAIWAEISAQQGRTVLVAEADGAVAGTADCIVLPNLTRGGRSIMFVENVVVAASHQRLGVGRLLLDAAADLGRSAGCYKLQLLAADDDYVHTFYESCGFESRAQGFRRYLETVRPRGSAS
ncbi:GNAT family N-acetyltransferase [Saccharopolyspora kobensis]|uniref:GNAT family N-acetyltransferase n=1 Tax=Saccharopolyspora kobensis TaxID=146035 RepID=UPI000B84ABFD|nr:GNAT family N-acetyltransferase [Saccharopolyspora kobensis]